jgi:hypothetical protein
MNLFFKLVTILAERSLLGDLLVKEFGEWDPKADKFGKVHVITVPGNHGRTTFKISPPRAYNLDTQGIVSGAPFDYHYEARRIGACPPGASTAR